MVVAQLQHVLWVEAAAQLLGEVLGVSGADLEGEQAVHVGEHRGAQRAALLPVQGVEPGEAQDALVVGAPIPSRSRRTHSFGSTVAQRLGSPQVPGEDAARVPLIEDAHVVLAVLSERALGQNVVTRHCRTRHCHPGPASSQ